jgi:hypothetical protein
MYIRFNQINQDIIFLTYLFSFMFQWDKCLNFYDSDKNDCLHYNTE